MIQGPVADLQTGAAGAEPAAAAAGRDAGHWQAVAEAIPERALPAQKEVLDAAARS